MKEALAMQLCHLSLSTTLHYIGIACDILYSEHKCNKFFCKYKRKAVFLYQIKVQMHYPLRA